MAGFEPTTSSTPCWRDTGLRYIPSVGTKLSNKDKLQNVLANSLQFSLVIFSCALITSLFYYAVHHKKTSGQHLCPPLKRDRGMTCQMAPGKTGFIAQDPEPQHGRKFPPGRAGLIAPGTSACS
jgi:hypothetical protein